MMSFSISSKFCRYRLSVCVKTKIVGIITHVQLHIHISCRGVLCVTGCITVYLCRDYLHLCLQGSGHYERTHSENPVCRHQRNSDDRWHRWPLPQVLCRKWHDGGSTMQENWSSAHCKSHWWWVGSCVKLYRFGANTLQYNVYNVCICRTVSGCTFSVWWLQTWRHLAAGRVAKLAAWSSSLSAAISMHPWHRPTSIFQFSRSSATVCSYLCVCQIILECRWLFLSTCKTGTQFMVNACWSVL